MRIYRANGFVILEDVGSYIVNQLVAFKLANNIHIRQIGVSKKEVIVPYYEVQDENGLQAAEDVDSALLYVESIIYGSTSTGKKTVTLNFSPPAAAYFNIKVLDVDAVSGDSYSFTPKYNEGEAEWNAFIATAFCFVDGEIELFIHAPTGLFVGEYEFEYKVI